MNTDEIKNKISKLVGTTVIIKINLGRNKYDTIVGVVNNIYPYIFSVKTDNDIKTFSYVDILIKNVTLISC